MDRSFEEQETANKLKNFMPLGVLGVSMTLAVIGLVALTTDLRDTITSYTHSTMSLSSKGSSSSFKLYSDVMNDGGNLPNAYTCLGPDGGQSPPMQWKNVPDGTEEFLLTMTTDAYLHNGQFLYTRTDWALYDIDKDVTELEPGNAKGVGIDGGTYPDEPMYKYNPPCPSGSGNKTYVFTIYALSSKLSKYIAKEDDDAATVGPNMVELADKKKLVLASASITTSFCLYSDEQESCVMGNVNRHNAQRPYGPESGDVFWTKGKLHGDEQRLVEKQLAADEKLELMEATANREKVLKAAEKKNAAFDQKSDKKEEKKSDKKEVVKDDKKASAPKTSLKGSRVESDKQTEKKTEKKMMASSKKEDAKKNTKQEEVKKSSKKEDKKSSKKEEKKSAKSSKKNSKK